MVASYDTDITVNISLDSAPITPVGFSTVLIAGIAASFGVGFTERIRYYESAADGADDDDLNANLQDAIEAAFSQPGVGRVAVGRLDTLVQQEFNVEITGAGDDGKDFTVVVNGLSAVYEKQPGDTLNLISAGLKVQIDLLGEDVTVTDNGGDLDILADSAGDSVTVTSTHEVTPGLCVTTATIANVSAGDGLDEILSEDGDYYCVHPESRANNFIRQIAAWTEANDRLMVAQSSASGIIAATTTDIAYELSQQSLLRSVVLYHDTDSEWAALSWAAFTLAANPDYNSTIWKFKTLAGITPLSITATQKSNAEGKNANLYLTLGGTGATGNGVLCSGVKIDLLITADWLTARVNSRIQQILLNYSNRNSKIPYTDAGFAVFTAACYQIMGQGVEAGHFVAGTPQVVMPALADIPAVTRATRALTFRIGAEPSGAVEGVTVTGYVSLDLSL